MNKIAFLTLVVLSATQAAMLAADSDPGYGPRPGSAAGASESDAGGAVRSRRGVEAGYYKPTQRYYGKGYTVAYRFVRADARSSRLRGGGSEFDAANYRISGNSATTVVGESPRITTYHGTKSSSYVPPKPGVSTGAARTVVTSPSMPVKELPPIAEGPDKK